MIQWEYTIASPNINQPERDFLKEMGGYGWQLCFISYERSSMSVPPTYYFQRPIPNPSTAEKIFNDVKREVEGMKDNGPHINP